MSDSPMGEDIKRIVREMLHNELSLVIEKEGDSKAVITMILRGNVVGRPVAIEASPTWNRDHGHDGHYSIGGIRLDVK